MKKIFIFIAVLLCFQIEAQKTSKAHIGRVVDGDTYIVDSASYKGKIVDDLRIRIVNVDCPEIYFTPKKRPAQPFGDDAKLMVKNLIEGKTVTLTYYGKDKYGRVMAFVLIDTQQRLDNIILENGWGWAYKGYHPVKGYKHGVELMKKAKAGKYGLWSLPDPIEPSKWRNQ